MVAIQQSFLFSLTNQKLTHSGPDGKSAGAMFSCLFASGPFGVSNDYLDGKGNAMIAVANVTERQHFSPWILRSSIVGFTAGCRALVKDASKFGDLVKALTQSGSQIFGLIYSVEGWDDPMARQLILAGNIEPEVIQVQRENRLTPIEISVLTAGYQYQGQPIIQNLPAQSPISLDRLIVCDGVELYSFTQNLLYLQHLLRVARSVPTDELLIHHLCQAAVCYPAGSLPLLAYSWT